MYITGITAQTYKEQADFLYLGARCKYISLLEGKVKKSKL